MPPCTAVIFTSLRTEGDRGYARMSERLEQQRGRDAWYADYQVRVATVTRSYGPDGPR